MRRLLPVIVALTFIACKKESASNIPANETVQSSAIVVGTGTFQNGPYGQVTGVAKVIRNTNNIYEVVLDSFQTNNGPDLYVYLSKEVMPVNFIEAGKLRATSGTQVYPLAAMPDLMEYRYISIHCKAFNHLFGYASLQ